MTAGGAETIFALSSGSPPAAIAVVRISGPAAETALQAMAGHLPQPRRASLLALHDPQDGALLDRALALRFPGPGSATGEDVIELHLHGGRSVVTATLQALERIQGLRAALPGEFTRRAFANGRIDLAEAEGLADLLASETEAQRRAALALAGGALSRRVEDWQRRLLALSASLEAAVDFSDEEDVEEERPTGWLAALASLRVEILALVERPTVERLKDGIRVSIAGPPNAGKSSLLNALTGREAAITSELAGTTRDLIEAPVMIAGTAFLVTDTAGLRESRDSIEAIGVERAKGSIAAADIIVWLGDPADAPERSRTIIVQPKADLDRVVDNRADIKVSAVTGEGVDRLAALLLNRAAALLPAEREALVNRRHRSLLVEVAERIRDAETIGDSLIAAEQLRQSRLALDRVTGRAGVEEMLDALFGQFCIGK